MNPEEIKKDQEYYVKCTIGVTGHLSLQKVKVLRINKIRGKIYSFSCCVLATLSCDEGYKKQNFKTTFRVYNIGINQAYQFYSDKNEFVKSAQLWCESQHQLIDLISLETKHFS